MAAMKARGWLCALGMTLAVTAITAAAGSALVGCGTPQAVFPEVKSGDMPEGESWEGVYYNQVYGYLHLVGKGDELVGRWKRTDSSHWGELSGQASGNILKFTWTEHRYGAVGPSGDAHGTGRFVFTAGGENNTPELDGKYALDGSESVGDWHCVKQTNMKPDLSQITGDNPSGATGPDQWK